MSDPSVQLLETILAEVRKISHGKEGDLRDVVLNLATQLDKYHAEMLERFGHIEERITALEEPAEDTKP